MYGGGVWLVPVRPGSFQQLFGRYVQPETGVRVEYDCIGIGDGRQVGKSLFCVSCREERSGLL